MSIRLLYTWTFCRYEFLLCALSVIPARTAGADWPQFRGPTGDGITANATPPIHWSETENIRWKVALPGRGRSSPVLTGERIWLTFAVERGVVRARIEGDDCATAEHVALGALCLDSASGTCLWQSILCDAPKPERVHWLNSWATPTPVVAPGHLYCDFGAYGTACLESDTGKLVWKQRLAVDHQVGPGSSPILHQGLLVLVRDGRDAQYVAALDCKTGRPVWKTPRPPIEAKIGNLKKSFSTPLVIEAGGKTQMVVPGAEWVVSYDPASGKEIWRVQHGKGFSLASRPVFGQGLVYVSTGAMKPQLLAIRVDGQGDVTTSHVVWRAKNQIPLMSSPILVGKEIYLVSDTGVASCLDALTGALHWQERLGGKHLASPICAANRLYFTSDEGITSVLATGTAFRRLAENVLAGTVVASPAAVGRALFLRTDTHLYRIESRAAAP